MSKVVSIANQKGGIGKSTTAMALWAGFSLKGYKTLLIDLDPLGNTTYTTRADNTNGTIYELLTGRADIKNVIQKAERGDIIPAGKGLSRLDLELSGIGKEYKLKEAIEPVINHYDYIIIDTPPALSILTINALTASDSVIIPAEADIYSLQGIKQLMETIDAVRSFTNPGLQLQGILLTRHSARTILSKDMAEKIADTAAQVNTYVYNTVIREGTAIKEAQAYRQDIFTYAPKSNASKDYLSFIEEVIERSKDNG